MAVALTPGSSAKVEFGDAVEMLDGTLLCFDHANMRHDAAGPASDSDIDEGSE